MNLLTDQRSAIDKLSAYKVGALFMEAGTGKTRVTLELANSIPTVDHVFYFAPVRTIRPENNLPSIADEVNKWGGFKTPVTYCGTESISASERIYLEIQSAIINCANPLLIIDESLKIKNAPAKRTKRLLELSRLADYKLIMNGTPLSRNLLDLKPQMDFLSPRILDMTDNQFKDTFCAYTTITKRTGRHTAYKREFITGYENIDYLYNLIGKYVYECDLKLNIDQLYTTISYTVDEEEAEEYERLKKHFLSDETLLWKNNNIFLEMTQEMQHSYCCCEDKLNKLDDLFTRIPQEKSIIYCKYIDSRRVCTERYPKATVLSYQKESLSLNLQHLNHTIYFDKIWDYALRIQAGRRTFRTGQEYDCRYYDFTGNLKLETMIDKNIGKKISMSEYFKSRSRQELMNEL